MALLNCTLALTNLCYNLESEDIEMPKLPAGSGNFGMDGKITRNENLKCLGLAK